MTITIGRDVATSRLSLVCNGKTFLYGLPGAVPMSVSPSHVQLECEHETFIVKNLDINNFTYVDGRAVEAKAIDRGALIELGSERFAVDWRAIDQVLPPVADIRPLEQVWADYDAHRLDQQIADRRFNSLRSATGLITMAAIALSMLTGRQSVWFIILYVLAVLVSLAFTIKAYRDASAVPQRQKQQNLDFQKHYVCPHCGRFLGNHPYEILSQNACCPYCKTQFIH